MAYVMIVIITVILVMCVCVRACVRAYVDLRRLNRMVSDRREVSSVVTVKCSGGTGRVALN